MFQSWINGFVVASNLSRYLGRKLVNMFLLGFVFSYKEFQIMINPPRILAEVNRSKKKHFQAFCNIWFDIKDKTERSLASRRVTILSGSGVRTSSEPETLSVTNFMDNLSLDRAKVLPSQLGWTKTQHDCTLFHQPRTNHLLKVLFWHLQDPLMEYWGREGKKWGSEDVRK